MKTHLEEYKKLFKQLDDAIQHSANEGLPLSAVELSADEWTVFLDAFRDFKKPPSLLGRITIDINAVAERGETRYRGIKIFKEKSNV